MDKRFIIILVIAMIVLYLVMGDCKTCKGPSKVVNEGFSGCQCGKCTWDKEGDRGCVGCASQPVSLVAPPPVPKVCGPKPGGCACGGDSCNSCKCRVYKKPNYYGFGPWNWKYHYGEPYYIKFTNQ